MDTMQIILLLMVLAPNVLLLASLAVMALKTFVMLVTKVGTCKLEQLAVF
jgi:hypothetical protein